MINLIFKGFIILFVCSVSLLSNLSSSAEGRKDIMTNRLMEIMNERRAAGGRCGDTLYRPSKPLKWDSRLAKAALIHALDMAEEDRLSHNGRAGSDPGERIRSAGYKWMAYGENIGEGYRTADDMVSAWIKSEGHCRNIMNPLFKDVGAARIIKGKKIYWVAVFASPL